MEGDCVDACAEDDNLVDSLEAQLLRSTTATAVRRSLGTMGVRLPKLEERQKPIYARLGSSNPSRPVAAD